MMKRIEDQDKIMLLSSYKTLFDNEFVQEELLNNDRFEMHNVLGSEIENVIDRMLFDNAYEIFPN